MSDNQTIIPLPLTTEMSEAMAARLIEVAPKAVQVNSGTLLLTRLSQGPIADKTAVAFAGVLAQRLEIPKKMQDALVAEGAKRAVDIAQQFLSPEEMHNMTVAGLATAMKDWVSTNIDKLAAELDWSEIKAQAQQIVGQDVANRIYERLRQGPLAQRLEGEASAAFEEVLEESRAVMKTATVERVKELAAQNAERQVHRTMVTQSAP